MTELERRALLGDKQAQEECTRRGIVLPCPCCEAPMALDTKIDFLYHVPNGCALSLVTINNMKSSIARWNCRPAPPIGECGECAHWYKQHCTTGLCAAEKTDADFYCLNFKPKESEENG